MKGAFLLAILAACHGRIGDVERSSPSDGDSSGEPAPFEPAFALPDQQPQLLPFWVRLERVADVVGKPTDDPIFADLIANRLSLGDYDYAGGVNPDRLWSPARMALWARSLKPVCASGAMKAAYPGLAASDADAVALASAAWGRSVDKGELSLQTPTLELLSEGARYEAVCLAILSSAELVIQ